MGNKMEESDVMSLLNKLCIKDIHPESQSVWQHVTPTQKWEIANNKPDKNNLEILLRLLLSSTHETFEVSTHHIYFIYHHCIHYGLHDNLILPAVEALISSHFHWLINMYKSIQAQSDKTLCGYVSLDLRYFAGWQRAAMCWLDLERTDEISYLKLISSKIRVSVSICFTKNQTYY